MRCLASKMCTLYSIGAPCVGGGRGLLLHPRVGRPQQAVVFVRETHVEARADVADALMSAAYARGTADDMSVVVLFV